jgi:hypothetical protein
MNIENIDKYLTHATFGKALPESPPQSRTPLSEAQIKDNLRRLAAPCLVTVHPDGTRSYKHDVGVQRDVLISTVSADLGEGSKDSIKLLREEGDSVKVDGLLPRDERPSERSRLRDTLGRFTKR